MADADSNTAPPLPYALPAVETWQGVSPQTVSELLRRHEITAGECGRMLHMNPRKVREWIGGVLDVPYPYWYCLLDKLNRREQQRKDGSGSP